MIKEAAPIFWTNNSEPIPDNWKKADDPLFNTLAQLRKKPLNALQKRARSKFAQNDVVLKLCDLESELSKSYRNTYYCAQTLVQKGLVLTGRYCGNRWCLICNRIKTGKLINGYLSPLKQLQDKHFVTLTIKNVPGDELKKAILKMKVNFKLIQETARKKKVPLVGLRKFECTFNSIRNDFHPHFHAVISGRYQSEYLLQEWLYRYPNASDKGQDIRPATDESCKELFKYFTKLLSKGKRIMSPVALDIIFNAMKDNRVFQPIGGFRKDKAVSEEIENIRSEVYEQIQEHYETYWQYCNTVGDWYDVHTGECLTGYSPSEAIISFKNSTI